MTDTSDELNHVGLKATNQRLRILEIFRTSKHRHLSADDIYQDLLNENSAIGLATVYRALTQFEQAGLVERRQFETGKSVFEITGGDHHDHLICLNCGHVEEFFDETMEARQNTIAEDKGFVVRDHALNLFVECQKEGCSRKNARANNNEKPQDSLPGAES